MQVIRIVGELGLPQAGQTHVILPVQVADLEVALGVIGILVLGDVPDPENYSTYFMKIDGVKFKRKVVPGDTLQFEIHLMEPIRRGVAVVEAKAFVGETLACEAVLMAQVVKNKNNK